MRLVDVQDGWRAAVGPQIAAVSHPTVFDRGVLHVAVASSSWARDLGATGLAPVWMATLPETIDDVPLVAVQFHVRQRQAA